MGDKAEKGEKMPLWRPPSPLGDSVGGLLDFWDRFFPLRVSNSLTRTKTRFVPRKGRRVNWYMCGPTVYAPSHMGHARTYLHFDILRRIMGDYFGYDVLMCMCITDIDDKIITRSQEKNMHFRELAAFYEDDFMQDVAALGIKPVEVVTRVSEFIPDIIKYVSQVVANGYAYESNGSVYFNVAAFHKAKGHTYAKLVPESVGNSELLAEGEGALSCASAADKKSQSDFALWKCCKPGEPNWESPWGPGRPGWHIECSVMASGTFEALGGGGACGDGGMDIHSGGVDLRFPHHDNELAQSEAYYDTGKVGGQWVNYFLHTGHLHIKGFKMSKSLKNFITIKDALTKNSARQIRLLFLLHKYNTPMDYGDDTMEGALAAEKLFSEFFHNAKAALRKGTPTDSLRMEALELTLMGAVDKAVEEVHSALCDDFDTPRAMRAMQEVVFATNKYLAEKEAAKAVANRLVVRRAADFATKLLKTFGVIPAGDDIGFSAGGGDGAVSREETLTPVLGALAVFREAVRNNARQKDLGGVMRACDDVRDNLLPPCGVRLEDKGDEVVWKLEDPEVLARERETRLLEQQRREQDKVDKEARKAEQAARDKIPPQEWFRTLVVPEAAAAAATAATSAGGKAAAAAGVGDSAGAAALAAGATPGAPLYTRFDDNGVPTHDFAGEPVSTSASKKLAKEWKVQQKYHQRHLAAAASEAAKDSSALANGTAAA